MVEDPRRVQELVQTGLKELQVLKVCGYHEREQHVYGTRRKTC